MKKIKRIISIIIGCLFIMLSFNIIYWADFFNSLREVNKSIINSCIDKADGKEMQYRLKSIALASDNNYNFAINKSLASDPLSNGHILESTHAMVQNDTSTVIQSSDFNQSITAFEQIVSEIKITLHQNIDNVIPVNLCMLDSLLNIELKKSGIYSEVYYSEIISLDGKKTVRNSPKITKHDCFKPDIFTYAYDKNNAYQIYMPSLTSIILKQVTGIIISTLIIIILLGIAFIYLIKILMQQKSLEEMKDDFTNNMTHELKTPIAVTYSAVDTLLNFKQGEDKQKRAKYLQICLEQLTKLEDLVEQILSMSMEKHKSLTLHKEDLFIKDIVYQQIDLHKLKADKKTTFNVQIEPSNMKVYADNVHMNNVIGNLLENGIKYSDKTADICIICNQDENYSYISIKDAGIGIKSQNLKRIFDKFYRVPNGNVHNVKGYGLGLFYIKQIVEKHNGEVMVKSTFGKGSVFTIKIPRNER